MIAEPDDKLPPMNVAIENMLARAGDKPFNRQLTIETWILLGYEYLAREAGRSYARHHASHMEKWIRAATPTPPWPK